MVITGLIRNQFGCKPTWVRIPHPPPASSQAAYRLRRLFMLRIKKPSLAHSAAPPFPAKPCGFAGCPDPASNHAGFWIFLFCPSPGFCPRFGLFFPKVRKELCAIFSPFLRFDPTGCRSGPPAAERSRPPLPAPRKASTYSPDGRRCWPW